jgi:ketosteroid isomerase-like protein
MSAPEVEFLREFYSGFERGDLQTLARLVSPDFLFVPAGKDNPLAGERRGPGAMLDFARKQLEMTEGTWIPRPYDVLVGRDHAAVLVRVDAKRGERRCTFHLVHVWRIVQGVGTELRSLVDDLYAYDSFMSGE